MAGQRSPSCASACFMRYSTCEKDAFPNPYCIWTPVVWKPLPRLHLAREVVGLDH